MAVTTALIKELRERTGAGMLDCKKALEENNGDVEKAIDWLREKGIAKAAKKSLLYFLRAYSAPCFLTVRAIL